MGLSSFFRAAAFLGAVCLSASLYAQELVTDENGFVTGIDSLRVGGATYNVGFEAGSDGSYDGVYGSNTPTFLNN